MQIEQIYTGCLKEAAYFIHSNSIVAIIDPIIGINEYLYHSIQNKLNTLKGDVIVYPANYQHGCFF